MRDPATGIYIPDVSSWLIEYTDSTGTAIETYDSKVDPGGIIGISYDLDGLGLLSSATLETTIPPDRAPFSHGVRLKLRYIDAGDVEQEEVVWEGYYNNFKTSDTTNGQGAIYTLEIQGLHKVIDRAYWYKYVTTFPPSIPDLGVIDVHNLLGISVPSIGAFLNPYDAGYQKVSRTVKVSEVMEKALESFSDGTWGVDGERRMLLGRPQDGTPYILDQVIGLVPTSYEIPPYISESRSDSGGGWEAYGQSRATPDFTPRVAQDATGTTNNSITTPKGPQWQAARVTPEGHYIVKIDATFDNVGTLSYYPEAEVRDGFDGEDFHDNTTPPGTAVSDIDLSSLPKAISSTYKADMIYIVADPQSWYEASSLYPDSESNYEPVQAAWQIDLKLFNIPQKQCGSYTGNHNTWRVTYQITEWLSESPTYDLNAVGKAGTPVYKTIGSKTVGADPYDPYGGSGSTVNFNQLDRYEGVDSPICVYPRESTDTITILREEPGNIDITYSQSQGPRTAFVEISPKWFREDQRDLLITNGWSGRYYYHAAISYTVTLPGDATGGVYPAYQDPGHPDYPDAGRAKAEFSLEKPFFSQKERAAPLFAEDLIGYDYPFYTGPNYEGWVVGALVPPAKVVGDFYQSTSEQPGLDLERPGKVSISQYVAGVATEIRPGGVRSSLRTNVLPYKRFDPYAYNRRYN